MSKNKHSKKKKFAETCRVMKISKDRKYNGQKNRIDRHT